MHETNPTTPTPLVCVGASAGGLQAISELVTAIPTDVNFAVVVVQHLSPDHKSMMRELISKTTTLAVEMVTDGMQLQPSHVYLLPAGFSVTVQDNGLLRLQRNGGDRRSLFPVDILFQSAADVLGSKAIAVILSGTGSDGTLGVRAVKDAGGTVMVQSPSSAQFDGMPRSAINARATDLIAPPSEITRALVRLTRIPSADDSVIETPDATVLERLVRAMANASGFDLTGYRPSTLIRRAERRMLMLGIETMDDYADVVVCDEVEASILFQESLIGVTRFFRDEDVWNRLDAELKADAYYKVGSGTFRAWSVGCSTGEEPYTLAMTVVGALGEFIPCKIFATDLDRRAVQLAAAGDTQKGSNPTCHRTSWTRSFDSTSPDSRSLRLSDAVLSFHRTTC